MSTLINITSVPAEKLESNQLQIIARWKDTDKQTIAAANRVRAVILPSDIWMAELKDDSKSDALVMFMHDAVEDLAKSYLSAIVRESNWQRTQVPQESFALSALLAWNAEQAALNGRLNSDEIKNWLSESVTIREVRAAHGDNVAKALGEQFTKLAGPNHGLTPERAGKIVSNLWKSDDCDSMTGLRVLQRLQAISNKSSEQNVLDSIL